MYSRELTSLWKSKRGRKIWVTHGHLRGLIRGEDFGLRKKLVYFLKKKWVCPQPTEILSGQEGVKGRMIPTREARFGIIRFLSQKPCVWYG